MTLNLSKKNLKKKKKRKIDFNIFDFLSIEIILVIGIMIGMILLMIGVNAGNIALVETASGIK